MSKTMMSQQCLKSSYFENLSQNLMNPLQNCHINNNNNNNNNTLFQTIVHMDNKKKNTMLNK